MRYLFTYAGTEYDSDTLTGIELLQIEKATGTPWSLLSPIERAGDCIAMLTVFLVRDHGEPGAAALAERVNLRTMRDMVNPVPDDYELANGVAPFEEPTTSV
jgi:hypothetical protein